MKYATLGDNLIDTTAIEYNKDRDKHCTGWPKAVTGRREKEEKSTGRDSKKYLQSYRTDAHASSEKEKIATSIAS